MGKERAACCEKISLNKGTWTPKEDMKLTAYVQKYGHENWRSLPERAGLARCGKSCRLRWKNYLRPGLKRGNITKEEVETIIKLHQVLGNKWSKIAARLPGRTDNEIKNVWNTHIKKQFEPKESKLSRNKKDGAPPTTSSQSVSCSDMGSVVCDQENSSDESSKILIELEECFAFKELIEHTEITHNHQISSPSVPCSASSKQESCHTEKNNMLIELDQSLPLDGFEISVNDYQIAPSQMDMHAYNAEINQPMFSSPSFSCSNPPTNTDFNIEECKQKQDANILIELEEYSLASPELFKLSVNDYHVYASSAENNQPITSPSFSCSNCIANSEVDIKCGQDPPDEKNNFLIELLNQWLPSTDNELSEISR